jgi:hypothetical protein
MRATRLHTGPCQKRVVPMCIISAISRACKSDCLSGRASSQDDMKQSCSKPVKWFMNMFSCVCKGIRSATAVPGSQVQIAHRTLTAPYRCKPASTFSFCHFQEDSYMLYSGEDWRYAYWIVSKWAIPLLNAVIGGTARERLEPIITNIFESVQLTCNEN